MIIPFPWCNGYKYNTSVQILNTRSQKHTQSPELKPNQTQPRPTLTSDACVWSICNSIWSELVEMIDSHSLVKSSTEHFAAFLDEELDSDKNHVMCVFFLGQYNQPFDHVLKSYLSNWGLGPMLINWN